MKKLVINYEVCNRCPACVVSCSYPHHPVNNGITTLREAVAFAVVCRRCDDAPCIAACPTGALKREERTNRRSRFVCVSCKTCSLSCPFGTILPECIPYIVSGCDFCLGRLADGEVPLCVRTCPYGALRYVEEAETAGAPHMEPVGDHLIVQAVNWLTLSGIRR